jgi:hypothetical protein
MMCYGCPYYCKFAVQEIADTLAGTDKIVLIKPSKSDMALWLGGVSVYMLQELKFRSNSQRIFYLRKKQNTVIFQNGKSYRVAK